MPVAVPPACPRVLLGYAHGTLVVHRLGLRWQYRLPRLRARQRGPLARAFLSFVHYVCIGIVRMLFLQNRCVNPYCSTQSSWPRIFWQKLINSVSNTGIIHA